MSGEKKIIVNNKNIYLFNVLGIAAFQIFWILKFKMYVQSDDFGYIADTFYFAGYNWNNYTGDMTPYYSIGFSWIPALLVRLTDNFIYIYQGMLGYILVLQIISYYLVYKIVTKYLNVNGPDASFITLIYSMSSIAPQTGQYFMSEIPFALCNLIIIYCLLGAINKEKKILYSIICAIALAYSYSIHTRFLVTFFTVIFILIVYQIIFHKNLVNYATFTLTFTGVFFITLFWVKYVQHVLYKPSIVDSMQNGNEALTRLTYIPDYIKLFTNLVNWKNFILTFSALLSTYTLLTMGIIWILLIENIKNLIAIVREASDDGRQFYLLLNLFGLVSFIGMNILIAINGISAPDQTKWLTFFRYAKPYVGILFLSSVTLFFKNGCTQRTICQSIGGIIYSVIIIIMYMIPSIESNPMLSNVGWMQYYFWSTESTRQYFMIYSVLCIWISLFLLYLIKKDKGRIALIIFLVYSLILTCSENNYNIKESEKNYSMIDGTWNFMEEYGDKIDLPIYFIQETYSGKLRFILGKYNMKYILNIDDLETIDYSKAIVFSDSLQIFDDKLNRPQYCFELDKCEYMYTSNNNVYLNMLPEYSLVEDN